MVNIVRIEELRMEHGYTQEQVAIMMGYQVKSAYNGKIKNVRKFSVEDIVKLCKIYNVELSELIILN